MLSQLAIRDIVLIDKLALNFREGLSVLTGETGAGKSILLDAFALALGGRAMAAWCAMAKGRAASPPSSMCPSTIRPPPRGRGRYRHRGAT